MADKEIKWEYRFEVLKDHFRSLIKNLEPNFEKTKETRNLVDFINLSILYHEINRIIIDIRIFNEELGIFYFKKYGTILDEVHEFIIKEKKKMKYCTMFD